MLERLERQVQEWWDLVFAQFPPAHSHPVNAKQRSEQQLSTPAADCARSIEFQLLGVAIPGCGSRPDGEGLAMILNAHGGNAEIGLRRERFDCHGCGKER